MLQIKLFQSNKLLEFFTVKGRMDLRVCLAKFPVTNWHVLSGMNDDGLIRVSLLFIVIDDKGIM